MKGVRSRDRQPLTQGQATGASTQSPLDPASWEDDRTPALAGCRGFQEGAKVLEVGGQCTADLGLFGHYGWGAGCLRASSSAPQTTYPALGSRQRHSPIRTLKITQPTPPHPTPPQDMTKSSMETPRLGFSVCGVAERRCGTHIPSTLPFPTAHGKELGAGGGAHPKKMQLPPPSLDFFLQAGGFFRCLGGGGAVAGAGFRLSGIQRVSDSGRRGPAQVGSGSAHWLSGCHSQSGADLRETQVPGSGSLIHSFTHSGSA